MKKVLLTLIAISLITVMSCKKGKKDITVRYEVETRVPRDVTIEWTTTDGAVSGGILLYANWENEDEIWTYSFDATEELDILFTGKSSSGYDAAIRLYINEDLYQSAISSDDIKATIRYSY